MEKDLRHILNISFFHCKMVVICTAAASGGCSPLPGLTQCELSSGEQVQHHLLEPWRTKGASRNCILGPVPAARPKCRTAGGFSRGSDRVLGQVPVQAELWSRSTCRRTEKLQAASLLLGSRERCLSNIAVCRRPVECGSWAGHAVQAELLTPHAGQPKNTASFAPSPSLHLPPCHRFPISTQPDPSRTSPPGGWPSLVGPPGPAQSSA